MKKILLQCVSSNKIYIFLKRSEPFQGYFVILYDSVRFWNRVGTTCKRLSLFVLVQRENMRRMIEGYRFCRPIPWFTLSLESPEKLNLCYNYIKEKISQHWRICVTCKLEKQPLGSPCCTGNGFCHTLGKCLGK